MQQDELNCIYVTVCLYIKQHSYCSKLSYYNIFIRDDQRYQEYIIHTAKTQMPKVILGLARWFFGLPVFVLKLSRLILLIPLSPEGSLRSLCSEESLLAQFIKPSELSSNPGQLHAILTILSAVLSIQPLAIHLVVFFFMFTLSLLASNTYLYFNNPSSQHS